MLESEWAELQAQVKEHGPELITFYLLDAGEGEGSDELLELTLDDVQFVNNEIQVTLE